MKSIVSGSGLGRSPRSGEYHIQRGSPVTGMSSPTSAPTSRDQTPAVQTTVSVAIVRLPVETDSMRPSRTSISLDRLALVDARARPRGRGRVAGDDRLGGRAAVERTEGRGEQAVGVELRHDRERLVDGQLARRNAERMLQLERGAEPLDVARVVQQEQVAGLLELDLRAEALAERGELVDRAQRDADVQLVGELRADPAGGLARRAGRERLALEQDDVGDARARVRW